MWTSTSSASGRTATVAVDVWMRPCDSVSGTRCTRCVPPSNLNTLNAPSPLISTVNVPSPASMVSARKPRRSADVDLEVVGVDVDLDVLGLREDRDGGRRRVDAALRLRLGHPLHAVRAALELEHAERAIALDLDRERAVAGVHGLGAEAAALG